MEQNNEGNAVVARDATEWQKKKAHQDVMARLSEVSGYYAMEDDYDQYPVRQWHAVELSIDELKEIMARENTTEIAYMIYRYGEMVRERGYGSVLPPEIQLLIVKRNNFQEVDAYTAYQGFCEEAQDVVLSEWSHERIMLYISLHGFSPDMQRKLWARQDLDEMALHIRYHGLDDGFVKEMFDILQKTQDYSFFYLFIENHELSVVGQKLMLSIVSPKAFSGTARVAPIAGLPSARGESRPVRTHTFMGGRG